LSCPVTSTSCRSPPLSVAADLQLQVLERVIPAATVEPLLERFGVTSKRERKLPAKFMVYFIIALCLFKHKAMRETLRTVLEECPTIGDTHDRRRSPRRGPSPKPATG